MKAGDGGDDLEVIVEPLCENFNDDLATDSVDFAHFADMPGESAIVNELGQCHLEGHGRVPVRHFLRSKHGGA